MRRLADNMGTVVCPGPAQILDEIRPLPNIGTVERPEDPQILREIGLPLSSCRGSRPDTLILELLEADFIISHDGTWLVHGIRGLGVSKVQLAETVLRPLLYYRASVYEYWAQLAFQLLIPRGFSSARAAHVFLASYVKYATLKSCFREVVRLLECARLNVSSPTQLSRELKEFESDYPRSKAKIKLMFQKLHHQHAIARPAIPESTPAPRPQRLR
jgi:hypothetical protein